jgi:hypothetical protein
LVKQARATCEALAATKEVLNPDDDNVVDINGLCGRARKFDAARADLVPQGGAWPLWPCSWRSPGVRRSGYRVASRPAVAIDEFLAQQPDKLRELETENEALQSKLREAEARAINLVDDQLRDRCTICFFGPGRLISGARRMRCA